jgi:hypothetical protein
MAMAMAMTWSQFHRHQAFRLFFLSVYFVDNSSQLLKKFLYYMRIPHGRTINLLMVAIKRQKQKILLLNIANAWCRWNCDHVIAIAIAIGY